MDPGVMAIFLKIGTGTVSNSQKNSEEDHDSAVTALNQFMRSN
jgi:hypothetical protein